MKSETEASRTWIEAAGARTGKFGEDRDSIERIERLQKEVEELQRENDRKSAMLDRFQQYQIGDQYLSQDNMIKDAIDEHNFKQN